jgi:hypothetical protein
MKWSNLGRYLIACSLGFHVLTASEGLAWAGCPEPCEIDVDPPILEPAQGGCADVQALGDDCECGITVKIANVCTTDVVALDFTLSNCGQGADTVHSCTNLKPQNLGWFRTKLHETGPAEVNLTMQSERGEEKAKVRGNVTHYGGCVCSVPGSVGDAPSSPGMPATYLLIAGALVRRCMRRGGH